VTDTRLDVVVVGGGIAGVSVAHELAADRSVLLLEAEAELARHTTGRSAASYIPGHGPAPVQELTTASRPLFDALAEEAGHPFLTPRPVLYTAHDADEAALLRRELLPLDAVDELTVDEACRRWPALRPDRLLAAGWVGGACDVDAMGLHQHWRRGLVARGGEIRTGARVTSLEPGPDAWRVGLGEEHVDAGAVVLAAGAWTDQLLALAGAEPFVVSAGDHWYAKPEGEFLLVSPSEETPAEPGDPRPDELDVAIALERVNAVTTLGLRSVATSWTGLRTFAPDRLPVRREALPGLWVFAGQGGYGIESSPAAARAMAAAM
jgi:D-arginine dehydrogenase